MVDNVAKGSCEKMFKCTRMQACALFDFASQALLKTNNFQSCRKYCKGGTVISHSGSHTTVAQAIS